MERLADGGLRIHWPVQEGGMDRVESSASLKGDDWVTDIRDISTGTAVITPGNGTRFYRIVRSIP